MLKKYDIAYQGMNGSYSKQTISEFGFKNLIRFKSIGCKNFRELFEHINNKSFLGMIPIENTTAGSVVECYDLFLEYDFEIIGEYKLPIKHCLLANNKTKLKNITQIYSHPQALTQCSKFIEKYNITPISNLDTAGSAEKLSKNPEENSGAIASKFAAKKYNLKILKENFQNENHNTTRFLLVKKKSKKFNFEKKILKKANKSTVIFETKSIPAALYKCLSGFATNNVNLTKIESRPVPKEKFKSIFYIDFQGNFEDENVKLAITELEFFSEKLIKLGSYKKHQN